MAKVTVLKSACTLACAVIVSSMMAAPSVAAQDKPAPECSVATLTGLYIFEATGYVITPTDHLPKAVVEFLNMNGDGTLTSVATADVNGNVINHQGHGTGSYSVNADCTGTLAFTLAGIHFDIYVAPRGTEFHLIQVDAGNVLAGKAKQVSRSRPH
jgi:hypothetical protein